MVQTDAFGHSRPSFPMQKKNHHHREQCLMTKNMIYFYLYYFIYIADMHPADQKDIGSPFRSNRRSLYGENPATLS